MTDEAQTAANEDDFHRRISACIQDINALLPGLNERYSIPEILSAFAEHVGGAFYAFRQNNILDDAQTLSMIDKLERAAFRQPANQR